MKKFKEILFLRNLKRVGKATIYGKYWNVLNESEDIDDLLLKIKEMESKYSEEDLQIAKDGAEKLYDFILNSDIHVITVFDEEYPKKLQIMGNKKPLFLYIKGNVESLTKPNIAVIGTRKPSYLSKSFEENLVKNIVNSTEFVVVSGLALGCDKIAHKTTVDENNVTIAVLPSGVNVIKPASHKKLAEDIISAGGCLVSEYNPDAKVTRGSYVERDAIVAALCDAIFVVECGVKSGTMHTVNAANDYKRQIYSYLPYERPEGSYDGNEFILNENYDATRVEDIGEFIEDLKILYNKKTRKSAVTNLDDFK